MLRGSKVTITLLSVKKLIVVCGITPAAELM